MPPSCAARPWTIDRPRPVPLPTPLVEKNGSIARASVSLVHADAGVADGDADIVAGAQVRAVRGRGSIALRSHSVPPRGMASRALIARLRIASSSWFGSTRAGGRSGSHARLRPRSSGRSSGGSGRVMPSSSAPMSTDARLQILAPREGEQPLDQRRRAARRLQRRVDQPV